MKMENGSGLVVSIRFGQGCNLGGQRIELNEPIAGFKVLENESLRECYLPVSNFWDAVSHPDGKHEWYVYRPSFTSSNCTLALVPIEWIQTSQPGDSFPPGVRMEFTLNNRTIGWDNQTFQWLGNGVEIQINGTNYIMLEGDKEEIDINGTKVIIILENLKGRSGAQFRFLKPFSMHLQRDI